MEIFLDKSARLSLKDGRTLEGILVCVDRQENFVLNGATGFNPKNISEAPQMLLVPGRFVTKIEILETS
jgi:small nuclear ribonucleoprotein (snRNP)-like protein